MILEVLAAVCKIVGVGFLVVAAIGVYRFSDPFMRMHAATKAGTLGAGLVALATALGATDWSTVLSALATIAFLLMTLPVASHLLGRATYVSGAAFDGSGVRDALAGVLTRAPVPLEERLAAPEVARIDSAGAGEADTDGRPVARLEDMFEATIRPKAIDQLLLAGLDGIPSEAVLRARRLARSAGIETTLLAFVDTTLLDQAPDRGARDVAAQEERRRVSALVDRFEASAPGDPALSVQYAEGDPFRLVTELASPAGLLVLPLEGWFTHGVALPAAGFDRTADGLLVLAEVYAGHTLFVPSAPRPVERVIAIDDGSTRFVANLTFSVHNGLWPEAEIVIVGAGETEAPSVRRLVLESVLNGTGVAWRFAGAGESRERLAATSAAAVLAEIGKPLRTNWYGSFWQDRIAPGWRGEVLVG